MGGGNMAYGSYGTSVAQSVNETMRLEDGTANAAATPQRRKMLALSSVVLVAMSMMVVTMYIMFLPEVHHSVELVAAPPKSEKKIVHAAEDATKSFADADVTTAALKAQRAAKAQYEKMIASALQAEAKAHQEGEKATQQALMQDNLIEQRKMATRLARARRDREVQSEEDAKMSRAISTEVQRTLISRVQQGV